MNAEPNIFAGLVGLGLVLLLAVISVLWIILPFAVFGIKRRLDELIRQQKYTNDLLKFLSEK